MSRTINQQMADAHEADIAEWTEGTLQKGSGNQWHRQGDTKNGEHLVPYPVTSDGKSTLGKSIAVSREMWRKLIEQTFNQDPVLFLRFYKDESLRTVDLDLAVVDARFLRQLLEDARKWEGMQQQLKDFILKGEDWTSYSIAEQERHPRLKVPLPAPDGVCGVGGCDCCR